MDDCSGGNDGNRELLSNVKSNADNCRENAASQKFSGADYRCDYCREQLANKIRIKCHDCSDFDLCVECFSMGLSVPPHEASHRYRVIEPIKTPLFEIEWTADEELLLLEGIQLYGFGNWADVAEHVGSKSKYRCETHFSKKYLESKNAPFPETILDENSKILNKREKGEDVRKFLEQIKKFKSVSFPSLKISNPGKPKLLSKSEMHPSMLSSNIVGFSPERVDFETEHDNDAEKMLSDMSFNENDTEKERTLKLKVIAIYNKKLAERRERKEFLIKRGVHSVIPKNKRKLSPEEKEIHINMRPFARFHSAENHEKLVNGLCNELRIRKRIEELQNYRLNGIRTFAEITSLENQKNQKKTLKPQTTLTRKRGYSESNDSENKNFELDEVEESLCESLGLEKQDYTKIKEAIERETFIKGMIDKNDEEALITIKIHKTLQQMNFFISKDWDFKGERVKPKEKI